MADRYGGFEPRFPKYIDSTMRASLRACPRKFFLSHILGCASPARSEHLHFGGALARGVEVARKGYYSEGLTPEGAEENGFHALLEAWGDFQVRDDSVKSLDNCVQAYEAYWAEYPLDADEIVPYRMSSDGAAWIEFTGATPLEVLHPVDGEPLVYVSRLDMAGVLRQACHNEPWTSRQVWAVDEKTTSSMGASWAQQWRLRGQFIGYTWALRQEGVPAIGALVRGIAVYKKQPPKFQQAFVPVSDRLIERWYAQLIRDLNFAVECWNAGAWDYDFSDACSSFGGCGYLQICELDDPEPFLEANFVERRWNPIEAEGTI